MWEFYIFNPALFISSLNTEQRGTGAIFPSSSCSIALIWTSRSNYVFDMQSSNMINQITMATQSFWIVCQWCHHYLRSFCGDIFSNSFEKLKSYLQYIQFKVLQANKFNILRSVEEEISELRQVKWNRSST